MYVAPRILPYLEVGILRDSAPAEERTNAAGLDEYRTEGNVVAVRCSGGDAVLGVMGGPVSFGPNDVPYALLATRDGLQQVRSRDGTEKTCGSIAVGDHLEADGQKDNELRLIAARRRPSAGDRYAWRMTQPSSTETGNVSTRSSSSSGMSSAAPATLGEPPSSGSGSTVTS